VSPTAGETLFSNQELRLFASAGYYTTPADSVTFHVDSVSTGLRTNLGTATQDTALNVYRMRYTSGLTAGTYYLFARATFSGEIYESRPARIVIVDPPTYGSTINLVANTSYTSLGTLAGSSGSRIKVNGNGFVINGSASNAISWDYVDFYNLGATSGDTLTEGMTVTTSGNTSVTNCRFINCCAIHISNTGSGTVTFNNNLWPSTSRNGLGANPFSDCIAAITLDGNSSGSKSFKGNNVAASWVRIISSSWTVGPAGTTDSESNIFIGPRCGLWTDSSSFTGTVRLNAAYCVYYGGWSQGSCFELWGSPATYEHNFIAGSSWPVRGTSGIFRYNFITGDAITEGLIWTTDTSCDIHHNVLRCPSLNSGRGMIYSIYAGNPLNIRNCTFDSVDQSGGPTVYINNASITNMLVNSCLIKSPPSPSVNIVAVGTLTADYNGFDNAAGTKYSDARTPTHDITGSSGITGYTEWMPFDVDNIWNRTLTVRSILADARTKYKPTSSSYDAGDTTTYGANNPIGAICRAGVTNASDLFGTL
jgi:hypothetical protein